MKSKLNAVLSTLFILMTMTVIVFLQEQNLKKDSDQNLVENSYWLNEQTLKANLALQKKLPTFGFKNLLADWQYLQFIQYLGDSEVREKTGYSAITDYFELISKNDPRFVHGLLMLSTTNSIYAAQPEKSVELLNKAIPYNSMSINPDSFFLWIYKGTDEILFTGDIPSAINSYEMSAKWASQRDDETAKTIAQRNRETVEFLKNNPDSKRAQVGAWGTILFSALDDGTRQMAIDKIKSLGGDVIINGNRVRVKLPEKD